MAKKILVILALMTFTTMLAFAQPANTITVDVGPAIAGILAGPIGSTIHENGEASSGFGIAAQYERRLSPALSVAGRFAYLGFGAEVTDVFTLDIDLTSFSVEGNIRLFPFGGSFFLNGLVGFTNFSVDFSNNAVGPAFSISRNHIKLGGKLGWQFVFGRSGNFVFEPSFGYVMGIGLGDSIMSELQRRLVAVDPDAFENTFRSLEQFVFVSGPRVSLAFGIRF